MTPRAIYALADLIRLLNKLKLSGVDQNMLQAILSMVGVSGVRAYISNEGQLMWIGLLHSNKWKGDACDR